MRKVAVFKYARDENNKWLYRDGKPYLVDDYEGLFHQFGVSYEEFDSGAGNYSAAIVEKQDGTVDIVPLNMIKFLDKFGT